MTKFFLTTALTALLVTLAAGSIPLLGIAALIVLAVSAVGLATSLTVAPEASEDETTEASILVAFPLASLLLMLASGGSTGLGLAALASGALSLVIVGLEVFASGPDPFEAENESPEPYPALWYGARTEAVPRK